MASSLVGWFVVELSVLDMAGGRTVDGMTLKVRSVMGLGQVRDHRSGHLPQHLPVFTYPLKNPHPPPAHRQIRFSSAKARGQAEGHRVYHDGFPATPGRHCDPALSLIFMPCPRANRLLEESNQGHPQGKTHCGRVW